MTVPRSDTSTRGRGDGTPGVTPLIDPRIANLSGGRDT